MYAAGAETAMVTTRIALACLMENLDDLSK